MDAKLFNGIIMVEKINYLISVIPVTLHHLHHNWIDYEEKIMKFLNIYIYVMKFVNS